MAIGRISGSVLKSNLTRNGTDLAFETNLLYLDVTNSRVGIGTSEPTTTLHVNGNTTISDTLTANSIVTNNISSADSSAVQVNDALNVSGTVTTNTLHTQTLTVTDINSEDSSTIQVDGSWQVSGFYYGDGRYLTGLAPSLQQYQFANTASDISTYYVAKNLADYTQGTAGTATVTVGTSGTLLASFATQTGYPNITVIPSGKVQILFETQKASGPQFYICYAEVHKRNTSGTETLLFTTDVTSSIVDNTLVQQDVSYFVGAPISLSLTDRLVIKIYAYTSSGTDDITLTWDSSTSAGLLLPTVPASATNFVPYFNATADVNLGIHGLKANTITANSISSDDSTAIQINDSVNISGTLTAPTFVTNNISSSDSSAVHVNGNTTITGDLSLSGSFAPGQLTLSGNTLSTNTSNADLELSANGTGTVTVNGLSLPTSDGSAGQFLKTDGSGTLSFATVSTNSVAQANSNVTVTDSGTGAITIAADGSTIITMNATTVLDASAVTNAIRLPNGTTAQRPSGSVGEIRYNSSTDTIEGYTSAGGWAQLGATTATAENTDDTTTGSGTAISTTQGVIDQFVTSSFDSAWYLTVTRDEINDEVSTAKHSLVHNDSSAFVATSHITESDPTNAYLTAQADVAGGNARLLGTGGSVVNSVSTYRIALGDNTSAGTTGNVVTTINTDVDSASEVVDSWAHASYRGAKYYISVNNASKTEVSNMEALVVHDGTTAFITTYGLVNTGSNDLLSLTAAINGNNVELSAAGNEPNLRVTMYKILLADDESAATGDSVNVVEATTVSSSATTIDSFATTAYTGAFYVFTGHNATEGAASISEVMVVANDEAYITTGPMVSSKGTDQLTFSASLSGQTVTVQAASTSGSSTTVNGYRVHMLRGSAGASTADTVLVSTEQTISGAKTFSSPVALTVGSDPSTVANNAHIYAKDEASSAEVFVKDEAGNVTKISPHNEAGEWEYYSRNVKTGKTVRINMEEMIRDIEKLTGKSYIKND